MTATVDTSSEANELDTHGTDTPDTEPQPFEPSPTLVAATDKANRLIRNTRQASTFNPRLHRRAAKAARRAMRVTDIERSKWEAKS